MPRYLSQHTLACRTRPGAEALVQRMQGGASVRVERGLVNPLEGKMFAEFRAESRDALDAWLKAEAIHYDWIVRIEYETRGVDGTLQSADWCLRLISGRIEICRRPRSVSSSPPSKANPRSLQHFGPNCTRVRSAQQPHRYAFATHLLQSAERCAAPRYAHLADPAGRTH